MSAYPKTPTFESVTVVLPVLNETYSLTQTVDAILESSKPYLREFLIVIADRTSPESLAEVAALSKRLGNLILVHRQELNSSAAQCVKRSNLRAAVTSS